MPEPLTPLLKWLIDEQADITGKDLAELSGIAPQTWSKVRQGKQDLSSDLLWRCMKALALLRPHSDCARVLALVEGKKYLRSRPTIRLADVIEAASDEELEAAMLQIVRRMFPKSGNNTDVVLNEARVKSPIPF